ncbi:MAG: hypothetical protein LUQ65_10110 [Candidatus Helarchaeota archaeon]|nr:hypothetical protein [Candidatus Helarchaeota archaeon]
MRVINEIWIINSSGITLFNISKDEKIDPLLFGGFFSAIQSFIKNLGETELKTLVIGASKITVYQGRQGVLFVSRSPNKTKDADIIESLKLVESKFFENYIGELDRIVDTSRFDNFGTVIEQIFGDTPEKRAVKALW